jgi:hypothetical protein
MNKLNSIKRIALMMIPVFMICIFNGLIWPQEVYSQENNTGNNIATSTYSDMAVRDQIELKFNAADCTFTVKNLSDGTVWKSYVDKSEIQSDKMPNQKWLTTMASLIILQYTNYNARATVPSADESVTKTLTEENGKYTVHMDFTKQKIRLAVNIWIEDNALQIEVPGDSIEEYGENGIMQIDFLPFFMSSQRYDTGYFFYPDGCGALYNFKAEILPNADKRYAFSTYSTLVEKLGPQDYSQTNDEITTNLIDIILNNTTGDASIPVFGAVKNNSAILAIIAGGDSNASINVEPCGFAIEVNRIFASTMYRYSYKDPRPEVAKMISYYEKDHSTYDAHIEYLFLSNDRANYSGMANAYRSYLVNEQEIVPHAGNYSGALSMFCGITAKKVLFSSFIAATTFSQAKSMLEELGAGDLIVNLMGSSKSGYNSYNNNYTPSKKLGGKSGLLDLTGYAKSQGNEIFVQENFVDIKADTKRPSGLRGSFIRDSNDILISDDYMKEFIVNPLKASDIFLNKYIKSSIQYGLSGITFARIGEVIVRDRTRNKTLELSTCISTWQKLLEGSNNSFGSSAAQGGNSYLIKQAGWLYDVPIVDTGCILNDESVPFYQMAVHGLIDYSGGPGNLTYDYTYTKLKWIETGCIPYFELAYKNTQEISETSYNELYSSSFSLWSDTVKSTYGEFRDILGQTQKAFIINHEKLSEDIVKVTYSNGIVIYINYSDVDWNSNGMTVPALNYIVVQPGV